MRIAAAAAAGLLFVAAAQPARSGLDPARFDRGVAEQDDLYAYVNGAWLRETAIPADRVSYGAFAEIADTTETDVRALIDQVAARPNRQRGTPAQQIADLYASVVDERRIEELGTKPIEPELRCLDAIASARDMAIEAGHCGNAASPW